MTTSVTIPRHDGDDPSRPGPWWREVETEWGGQATEFCCPAGHRRLLYDCHVDTAGDVTPYIGCSDCDYLASPAVLDGYGEDPTPTDTSGASS